ncbi:hypothetical protein EMIHUDRAFT_215587 [Emiliania huxleyi CCMP1516]|uniref:CS domain-containing protein n=2 Tax=Emiliania huxleyi TaxID=2903 RepID=A0A0D3IGM2_EMIH1|nr:hypothetical protein EMIHUDRAFT_215587 [Emiliania huxleyi CCMP1516]EOD10407.1 hypothetical protein EMIHUDRAFT_215587 [Emiliania huxleyi CCMP1516]|eukprot:XP_005762836.1 hypothetical protein EMIHUDRAFT_215587 [Emiliania huxleyi CCMP1516]
MLDDLLQGRDLDSLTDEEKMAVLDPPRTEAERLAYLRSRGVEPTVAVSLESAAAPSGGGDVLPGLLAPRFADDGVMDDATALALAAGLSGRAIHGSYAWSQTEEEVEWVREVDSQLAFRRVGVAYGRGRSLRVCFDGKVAVELPELFDAVVPDGCAWTLESGVLALTLEKADARPWATLALELTKA